MISHSRQTLIYVMADWISTSVAVLLFNIARYGLIPGAKAFYTMGDFLLSPTVIAGQVLFPIGMLLVYYMSGFYSQVYVRSRVGELVTTLVTAFVGTLVIIFVALINDLTNDRAQDYRVFFIVFGLLFSLVYIPRAVITRFMRRRIDKGAISFPTAVISVSGDRGQLDAFHASNIPKTGMKPVIDIIASHWDEGDTLINSQTMGMDALSQEVERLGITRFIVLPDAEDWDKTSGVVNKLYGYGRPVYMQAKSLPPFMLNNHLLSFTAQPLIDVSHAHMSASTMSIKRAADIVIGSLLLGLTAPIVGVLAIMVSITSSGPAFYAQERVGLHRRKFKMYKIRTMREDAEADGVPRLATAHDERVTPLGQMLRKYRFDELPQFWNVVRGDMSLVGPRPERPHFVSAIEEREPAYALLHRVRPGVTSLGMVKYGYASDVDQMVERMRYDLMYLQNISFVSDIKILFYTVYTVVSGKGI